MPRPKLDKPNHRLVVNRSGNYAVSWTEDGKTRSISTGTSHEDEARVFLDQFIAGQDQPAASAEPTIAEICAEYKIARAPELVRPENLGYWLKPIIEHMGNLTVPMVSQMTIRRYAIKRRDKKNDTIRSELKSVLAACRWATKHLKTSPVEFDMPVRPSPPREHWLTKDEARALLEEIKTYHTRIFIMLALMTGQRGIAICDLKWDSVNFERGYINFGEDVGKKRRATVPMNSQLRKILLEAYEARTCKYVVEYGGKKVKNPRKSVSRSAERAGLGKLGKHALRHTAITWMVLDGVPSQRIARYVGTTKEIIDRVYGHHTPGYLSDAAKAVEL